MKPRSTRRATGQRGAILLMTSLILALLLIPMVGLAIDAGTVFAIKSRLQTATDGAAIAAARSLSRGMSLEQQRTSAEATAEEFFQANMRDAWASLANARAVVSWPSAPPKTTVVRVDAVVDAPTYFMRMFGYNTVRLAAAGTANRRDVNIVLVLDRSGSVENLGACDDLRAAARGFAESFVDGRDRIGLVTFGTSYRLDFAPDFDFRSRAVGNMLTMIDNIRCIGGTNSAAAYWTAWQQIQAINEPNTLNVILFFTDGQPNTLHLNNLVVNPASGCVNKAVKNGVLTPAGGQIWGIFRPTEPTAPPAANPDWVLVPNSTGCAYAAGFDRVGQDIVSLTPAGAANEVDAFGTSLTGYKAVVRDANGRLRIDAANVTAAGTNALDNVARRVRTLSAGSGLDVYTYAIALGGAPAPAEEQLMRRIANVPTSPIFEANRPQGMYILANDAGQLEQAFSQLASDILRLSQ